MNKYKKVMLIYGGISSEREISIISSKGINDSLIRNNYEVVGIDADEDLKLQIKKHNPDVIFNAVQIFYNGNEKLATNNTGITVTGTVAATAYTGDGSGLTGIVGSGSGVVVKNSGSTVGTAGTIDFGNNLSVSPIHLGIVTVTGSAGSASTEFVAAQTLTVAGVSTFSDNVNISGSNLTLGDSSSTSDDRIVIGSGSDLHIFHNALDSHIDNNTGNLILRANVNSDVGGNIKLMPKASENGIIVTHDASVELYENNVKKLETTSSGISVTGDVEVSDTIFVANNIKHTGDTDTYIEFTSDRIRLIGGGKALIDATEAGTDSVVINEGSNDLDFRVEGLNDEYQIFSDGGTDRVGIGSAIPRSKLDVVGGDIYVGYGQTTGVVLTSPNGTKYRLVVADNGTLSTSAV